MTVLDSGDLATFQNAGIVTHRPIFCMVPLVELSSGEIDSLPANPMTELSVTNTVNWNTGNYFVGRAFSIEDTDGEIVMWGIQRKPSLTSVFYPDVKSSGDGGYARDIAGDIEIGYTLRVYQHRPAWGYLSRATATQAFKKWDVPYDGSGDRPAPMVNMGCHQHAFARANGRGYFTIDASQSFDWLYGTAGIQSHLTTLPAEAIIESGTISSDVITFSLPYGSWEVQHEVITEYSRSSVGYRYFFVTDDDSGSDNASFGELYGLSAISGDVSKPTRSLSVTLSQNARSFLFPGAPVLFKNYTYFDGVRLPDDKHTHSFCGYAEDFDADIGYQSPEISISCRGPIEMAKGIPTVSQLIETVIPPLDWTQVTFGLNNPAHALYYVLKHHTNILENHDLFTDPRLFSLKRQVYGLRQKNIGAQLDFIASMMVGEVTNRSDGTILFHETVDHLPLVLKNALDTKMVWTDADIEGRISIRPSIRPSAHSIIMDAIAYDPYGIPPAYSAIAPGYAPTQGNSQTREDGVMVRRDDPVTGYGGQEATEWLAGHRLASINNPLKSIVIKPLHSADICEPADRDWHKISISEANYLPLNANTFGVKWDDLLALPRQVTRTWKQSNGVWTMKLSVTLSARTHGAKGSYLPIERDGVWDAIDDDGWVVDEYVYQDTMPSDENVTEEDYGVGIAWNNDGYAGIANGTFLHNNVAWTRLFVDLEEKIVDMEWNYASGFLAVFVLTWNREDDELKLYQHAGDITDEDVSLILYTSWAVDSSFDGVARVVSSKSGINRPVCVAWLQTNGIWTARRQTGQSWQTAVAVGSSAYTADSASNSIGLFVDDTTFYCSGAVGNNQYKLFKAVAYDGAWTAIANHPYSEYSELPMPTIHRDGDNIVCAIKISDDTPAVETIDDNDFNAVIQAIYYLSSDPIPPGPVTYGFTKILQTDEQAGGVDYSVTNVLADFGTIIWYLGSEGDPPGLSGSPYVYFPPDGIPPVYVTGEIALMDKNYQVLWSSGLQKFHSQQIDTGDFEITYAPSPMGFTRIRVTVKVNIDIAISPAVEGVRFVDFKFLTDNQELWGTFVDDSITLPRFEVETDFHEIEISNKVEDGWRLYSIDAGTEVWTNITPDNEQVPTHTDGIAMTSNLFRIVAFPSDPEQKRKLLYSADSGVTWVTTKDNTKYTWIRRLASSVYLAGGNHALDFSMDGVSSLVSRLGNFTAQVGAGDIDGALVAVDLT